MTASPTPYTPAHPPVDLAYFGTRQQAAPLAQNTINETPDQASSLGRLPLDRSGYLGGGALRTAVIFALILTFDETVTP